MGYASLVGASDVDLLGRIALAALLGYVIGWEREFRGSPAGERTFALIALGAAAFTGLGVANFPASAEKVIAGVVTGVGFLGAGLIFRGERGLIGLTTAASAWAVAAAGVLVGAGEELLGVFATFLMLLILELNYLPFIRAFDARRRREREGGPTQKPDRG